LIPEEEHIAAYGKAFLFPGFRFGQFGLAILRKRDLKFSPAELRRLLEGYPLQKYGKEIGPLH